MDMKASGSFFTWENGLEPKDFIQERLDRVLNNEVVLMKYPNLEMFVPPILYSDHKILVLNLVSNMVKSKRRFKYEMKWQVKERYDESMECGWKTWSTWIICNQYASIVSQQRI